MVSDGKRVVEVGRSEDANTTRSGEKGANSGAANGAIAKVALLVWSALYVAVVYVVDNAVVSVFLPSARIWAFSLQGLTIRLLVMVPVSYGFFQLLLHLRIVPWLSAADPDFSPKGLRCGRTWLVFFAAQQILSIGVFALVAFYMELVMLPGDYFRWDVALQLRLMGLSFRFALTIVVTYLSLGWVVRRHVVGGPPSTKRGVAFAIPLLLLWALVACAHVVILGGGGRPGGWGTGLVRPWMEPVRCNEILYGILVRPGETDGE